MPKQLRRTPHYLTTNLYKHLTIMKALISNIQTVSIKEVTMYAGALLIGALTIALSVREVIFLINV